ncbi:MAG: aerial mycelium formation protein [Gammaproteobacteria bacterium]|nr:aerial mycelium formation protein [Gammaproteobacteria bacterium]
MLVLGFILQGCVAVPAPTYRSDAEVNAARARVQALDDSDYARSRSRRQDLIEDIGTLQMNKAKAIRKATGHTKSQSLIITDY